MKRIQEKINSLFIQSTKSQEYARGLGIYFFFLIHIFGKLDHGFHVIASSSM
jgi:hypothetical protein